MRKPKLEYYWVQSSFAPYDHFVNWRLVGANGETMCQCTQGFRDKAAAQENADMCGSYLFNAGFSKLNPCATKVIGPGRKPK